MRNFCMCVRKLRCVGFYEVFILLLSWLIDQRIFSNREERQNDWNFCDGCWKELKRGLAVEAWRTEIQFKKVKVYTVSKLSSPRYFS